MNASDYFAKVTTGDWAEARSGIHTLEDVNVQVFKLFLRWLYTGHITMIDSCADLDQMLVMAWALGDRLQPRRFKNVVMNALVNDWRRLNECYPQNMKAAILAYNLSPPDSKIRKLVCKKFAVHAHDQWLDNQNYQLPADLLVDLVKSMSRLLESVRDGLIDRKHLNDNLQGDVCADYHERVVGEEGCSERDIRYSFSMPEECEVVVDKTHPFAPLQPDYT